MAMAPSEIGQFLESVMLILFGLSWPLAVYRTWKAKRVEAKSVGFTVLVFIGYFFGLAAKFVRAESIADVEWVFVLYVINGILVGLDLLLILHYRKHPGIAPQSAPPH
ncbi:MAG TPA: hypothetical protein VNA25_08100 [Phycisphaerae bacterium]|nr:hypothetical protein [Phycisphaerae bacterium]